MQNKKEAENKRKFARIEIEIPAKFIQFTEGKDEVAYVHDISASGISVVTSKRLSANSPLELQLQIPDGGKTVWIKGKVVWVRQATTNTYKLGISVENLDLDCLSRALRLKLL